MAENKSGSGDTDSTQRVTFDYLRSGNRRSRFDALLLHADHELIVLSHEAHPSGPLRHGGEVVVDQGYAVVWFLFHGKPYDVGRFYRPDGSWTGYYVDILEPVHWNDGSPPAITPLVDLELDLWIAPDGSYQILDQDDFELSVNKGDLTAAQAAQARSTLSELLTSLVNGSFPPRLVQKFDRDPD